MKLSALKQSLAIKLHIIRASIVYTWHQETAYLWSFASRAIGSMLYTFSTIIFINLLFSRMDLIAGYSRDEMFIFYLVGQIALFSNVQFSFDNISDLIVQVNNGGLDLILSKPLPVLFYVSTKTISIFSFLVDELPSLMILFFAINAHNLHITITQLIAGILVFICGSLCMHVIQFIFALPVFWIGESQNLLDATWGFEYSVGRIIPYEGFSYGWRFFFSAIIPCLITTALTTSVLLGKSAALPSLIFSITVAFIALLVKRKMWNIALLNYTSASS